MPYTLLVTEAAELDIQDAFFWYENQKGELGDIFENHISNIILIIQKNPLKFQTRYNKIRVAFLKKFPYGVHFNLIEDEIIILAVFHTSQSPNKWKERL